MPTLIRSASSSGSLTATKPAGMVAGDYLLAVQAGDANDVLANMASNEGLPLLGSQAGHVTDNYPAVKAYGRVATAADAARASFGFTNRSGSDPSVILVALQAGTFDPANPIVLSAFTATPRTTNNAQTAPSVAGVADGLLLAIFAADTNGVGQSYPSAGPAGMTRQGTAQGPVSYAMVGVYSQPLNSGAATGTRSVTPTGAAGQNGWVTVSAVANPVAVVDVDGGGDTAAGVDDAQPPTVGAPAVEATAGADAATVDTASASGVDLGSGGDGALIDAAAAGGEQVASGDTASEPSVLVSDTETGTAVEDAAAVAATLVSGSDAAAGADATAAAAAVSGAENGAVRDAPGTPLLVASAAAAARGGEVAGSKRAAVEAGGVAVGGAEPLSGGTRPAAGGTTVGGGAVGVRRSGLAGFPTRPAAAPPRARPRLIAQSILSGQFVAWSLPVTDPEITWTLSGPTTISGSFRPEIRALADIGLEPWATWIHLEDGDQIRGSAILQPPQIDRDGTLSLEAIGAHGYAGRIPFRDRLSLIGVDPADIVRLLWAHIQGFPRGDLGVQVLGRTPITRGTEARQVDFVTGAGEQVSFTAGPYQLNYWENTIIGREIESLAKDAPFDFTEHSAWTSSARSAVRHWQQIHYPQAGSRRFDLRFAEGENILEVAPIEEPDDAYADTVYVAGKGEGPDQVTGSASLWVGNRLRLPAVVDDKTVDSTQRANALAGDELGARLSALVEVPEIVVDAAHRNAPLGSFAVGDEILPRVRFPYLGDVAQWHRITSIRYSPVTGRAALALTRRGEFR